MKQSALDKELNSIYRAEAKSLGWKSVSGMPYSTIGPLFFVFVSTARVKEKSFSGRLYFKWLELDKLLWRILDLSSNENEPFSLHANGAFVLSGQEILEISAQGIEWRPGVLAQKAKDALQKAAARSMEIASQIGSIESYLDFVRREHENFMIRHPQAILNVWKETLLVSMLTGDMAGAAEIAKSRIIAGDSGGFSSDGKSFYEHALEMCESTPANMPSFGKA